MENRLPTGMIWVSLPRHLYAAGLMGVNVSEAKAEQAGDLLADAIIALMKKTGMPNDLKAVGFGPAEVDQLVAGTLPQHRVTKLSPSSASADDLKQLCLDSMTLW